MSIGNSNSPLPWAMIPGAILQAIPAAGHLVVEEQPERLMEAIGLFLLD